MVVAVHLIGNINLLDLGLAGKPWETTTAARDIFARLWDTKYIGNGALSPVTLRETLERFSAVA